MDMEVESSLLTYALIGLLLVFFITLFALFAYSGLFTSIVVRAERPSFGPLHIVYKFARGPYKNAGALFTETYALGPDLKTIGIYYDDPQQINPAELRYCVGAVLSENDDPPSRELLQTFTQNGYKELVLPAVDHVVTTEFPFICTLSIFIAIARVYPKLAEYIQERKLCAHPMLEIYGKDKIVFFAPLSKQDEFYAEETRDRDGETSSENQTRDSDNESVPEADASRVLANEHSSATLNGPMEDDEESGSSSFEHLNHD